MSNIFVTSDHHFGHKNILKYQPHTRPFSDLHEMETGLIDRHNEVVQPDDEVYFLGDFSFTNINQTNAILGQMNGKKYFIFGNHDKVMRDSYINRHFEWMQPYHELKYEKYRFVLFHYPIHSWNRMHFGVYHLYGHTHGQIPHLYHGLSMDIGVDTNDCYPWLLQDIIRLFETAKTKAFDPRGRDAVR